MDVALLSSHQHIRPVRSRKDILAVADLIEICFADQMDVDGREYIRYLRRFAIPDEGLAGRLLEPFQAPVRGLVWEEDGQIVGNLSLISFNRQAKRYTLIANVATHPAYRRRGIARRLTETALQQICDRGENEAWLHVREDNPAAIQLYQSLGFEEHCRRTNWLWEPHYGFLPKVNHEIIRIVARQPGDWPQQSRWLDEVYPAEITWNLPLDKNRLKPNLWKDLWRWLNGGEALHLSARWNDHLVGVASWQPTSAYADIVWLAVAAEHEDEVIPVLLTTAGRRLRNGRPLAVNYPARRAAEAFHRAGFQPHVTLIWMRIHLS
ncbi:MAG: GNAT family N-acetyltransferase [Bellilinea sp.]